MPLQTLRRRRAARAFAPLLALLGLAAAPVSARLVPALGDFDGNTDPQNVAAHLPPTLSLTGLYDDVASPQRKVTEGIVAYDVNSPLWSDAASKERYITVPAGAKVVPTDTTNYTFPDKTILIKNFSVDTVYGDPASRILVETRFLILHPDSASGVIGLSYRWRRDQTDADLVDPSAGLEAVHTVFQGGVARGKKWLYPSKFQCTACHKGHTVLGFVTPQLNRPSASNPGENQLAALYAAGILTVNPLAGKPEPTFRWAGLNETGTPPPGLTLLEWKARSYLASNCSHCHAEGLAAEGSTHSFAFFTANGTDPDFSAADTALRYGYIGKPSLKEQEFPQIVYQGYPESSFVVRRMMSRSFNAQMPPVASYQIDSSAIGLMKDWICSLGARGSACSLPADQETDDNFWTTGIREHGWVPQEMSGSDGFAHFQGATLLLPPNLSGPVDLFDARGRRIPLLPVGSGRYRPLATLQPGLYFLKAGGTIAKVQRLP